MDKVLKMTYASSLTHLCEVNSSFDTGILRICYTGQNRNGSYLSRDVIEKCLPTIYNCPIVCNYDRESDTLGGHDMEVVQGSNGELRIVNATDPIGLITESSKVWFEDYEEDDGTIHEYLYAEALLWKRQEAYRKIKKDGVTAHSMEIKVKDGHSVDGVYHIDDFEFNAFALIGETPCFQSSALEMFSHDDFKQKMSEMMRDLRETFTMVNASHEDDNILSKNSTEGGNTVLSEKIELAAKYGIDVEALGFSLDDFTVEELTEKFEAMKPAEPVDEPANDEHTTNTFALTENITAEIRRVLSMEKFMDEWGDEIPHYFYVDCDFEAAEVYCWDSCDWLLYGFAYSMNGDSITIDYASKKRKKFVVADFEGDEQVSPIAPVFELVKTRFLTDYADVEAKFNAASEQIATMETELTELRQFKADTDNAAAQCKREKILAKFEDLAGVDAYEALKEDCANYDLDALEEKCFAIRGRNITTLKFSAEPKAPKLMVDRVNVDGPENSNEPYGGLFEKYAHGSN